MLIIATKSPFTHSLPQAATNASLLLTQDSVIAVTTALKSSIFFKIYALDSDLIARGLLDTAHSNPDVNVINLKQFVELTITTHPIMNW